MKLIRSILGRRQFLIFAFMTSTLGLVFKKLARAFGPGFETDTARSSGVPVNDVRTESYRSGTAGNFSKRYSHLLSPLKIGNVILKNRMLYTISTPHFLQGPENFPSEVNRSFYANIARSAAIVAVRIIQNRVRKDLHGDSAHMVIYDLEDYGVQNYLDQMVEGIHCYGSLASIDIRVSGPGASMPGMPPGAGVPAAEPGAVAPGAAQTEISAKDRQNMIDEAVKQAKFFQSHGFDMAYLGDDSFKDKDQARFTIEMIQAVKKACGQDFLIGRGLELREPSPGSETSGSNVRTLSTLEKEAVTTAKMFEGFADILTFKVGSKYTSFNQEKGKPPVLTIAPAIKESGAKIILCSNGGLRDPDLNEEAIASGKTDMIGMARAFICDPEYGKNVYEGRGEDTVPCIMCNKCHGLSMEGPWYSVCSVNPKLGIEPAVRIIDAPVSSKKVAVIGGGPAGMKAAITAAERGHRVTLYEKNDYLGGLLRHADFNPFKWAIKDFKDYLVRQVNKAGVEVLLNTEATPDMIRARNYDAILAAAGAEPVMPSIPGVDGGNVWNFFDVYGKERTLGKNVVVIGGGEIGTETGMYLAKSGHKTTVLTSDRELMTINRVHYPDAVIDTYEHMDNFDYIVEATTTRILEGRVIYKDAKGNEKSVNADSVVIYAGLRPRQDEALKFYGSAKNSTTKAFFTIGDCTGKGGSVQKSIRSAFFAASQL